MAHTMLPSDPQLAARQLSLVYFALLTGQIIFGAVVYFIIPSGSVDVSLGIRTTLLVVVATVALGAIAGTSVLFSARVERIRQQEDIGMRLRAYMTLNIIRYAVYEAPTLIALAGYTITASPLFLGIAVLLIAVFITLKPSLSRMSNDLGIAIE